MSMLAQQFEVVGVDLLAVAPEAILAGGGVFLLLLGAGFRKVPKAALTSAALFLVLGAALAAVPSFGRTEKLFFDGTVVADDFAVFCKLILSVIAALAVIVSFHFISSERAPGTEYYALTLFATAGMMLMASSGDLILIFVALETFSLALYTLAAFRRARLDSQEGALKYFLTGSFSSAFFLYGIALVYGAAGTTRLGDIEVAAGGSALLPAGVALLLVGLGFKVSAVPFHMWTPDAYQGSPAPVAGFMAAGSKVAGFAALFRVLVAVIPALDLAWRPVMAGLAVATIVIGTVVAIAQTNVKRMLAYSSIAHSGFLLVAVTAASERAISGSLFYLAVYTVTIVGAFGVVYAVGNPGEERVDLDDYRGLWARQPFLAGVLALVLISLAGVPPTAGFWAKFEVFSAAVGAGHTWLVVVAVLASAAAAFFYLRLIVLMFLQESKEWMARAEPTVPATGIVLVVVALVIVVAGVLPGPLLELAREATLTVR